MDTCDAPDPNTRTPRFGMPPHRVRRPLPCLRACCDIPVRARSAYTPPDAPKESPVGAAPILGIERAVIVQASCHGTDNRAMLDAIATSGGRYRGVAIVDASFTETDYAALHEGGIRGVRFNFVKHLGGMPDMDVFHHVIQRIRPLGWHLVVHLDAADIVEVSASSSRTLCALRDRSHGPRQGGRQAWSRGRSARCSNLMKLGQLLGESVRRRARLGRRPAFSLTPFRSRRRSSTRLQTACCGAPTGPTPTSAASCRTTEIWWTWCR